MDYLDQNIFLGKLSTCKKVTEKISEYETIAFTVPPANAQVRDIPPMTLGLQNIF